MQINSVTYLLTYIIYFGFSFKLLLNFDVFTLFYNFLFVLKVLEIENKERVKVNNVLIK